MKNKIFATLTIAALLLGSAIVAKTAVSTIAGLAVAQTSIIWNSVKDAAAGDNQTNGIMMAALALFDGTDFDRARGDTTFGLDVDVTRMPGSGQTPADAFVNPSTFMGGWSLNGLFNGTTWDRQRSAQITSLGTAMTLGVVPGAIYGYDFSGVTLNRYKPIMQMGNKLIVMTDVTGSFTPITTNTDTLIALGAGNAANIIGRLIVNTAGATSSAIVYIEPDGAAPCGGVGSSIFGTYSTLVQASLDLGNVYTTNALCITTAGGTPANLTVVVNQDPE